MKITNNKISNKIWKCIENKDKLRLWMQWWLVLENYIKLFTTVIDQLRKKA